MSDEDFRDDDLVRRAAVVMDPTYGRPVPAPRRNAADLIQMAHRQRRATVARRVSWVVVPVLLAVAAAIGLATGAPPEPPAAAPSTPAAPSPSPLAVADQAEAVPARAPLTVLQGKVGDGADLRRTGRYTYVHTRTWASDTTGLSTAVNRDEKLWWTPDRAGRQLIVDLTAAPAREEVTDYKQGQLAVPVPDPSAEPAILASQLAEHQPFDAGPHAALRAVVDLYRYHALDAAHRGAALRVLADTDGMTYLGDTVDRAGRPGVAVAADSDAGAVREVAVFDPETGAMLSYERLDRSADETRLTDFIVFLAAGHTDHAA
jgi:hypothetical protein